MSYTKKHYFIKVSKSFGEIEIKYYKKKTRRKSKLKNKYNHKIRYCKEVGNNGNYKKVQEYKWILD